VRRSLIAVLLAACSGGGEADDDAPAFDARASADAALDGGPPDGVPLDASSDVPLSGFGSLSGMCGVLGATELTGTAPSLFRGDLDFAADRYDDPADRPQLTSGGQTIAATPNAGGSSLFSEVFAFEILARCELAALVATETQIAYDDPASKRADLLVSIDGTPIGVSVTRAVTYPFGNAYTPGAATTLLTKKLDDIEAARQHAVSDQHWDTSLLAALAYDSQHADVLAAAWAALPDAVRRDTIVLVFVTSGDDLFIYTDQ
jgi:hypothetical protein